MPVLGNSQGMHLQKKRNVSENPLELYLPIQLVYQSDFPVKSYDSSEKQHSKQGNRHRFALRRFSHVIPTGTGG